MMPHHRPGFLAFLFVVVWNLASCATAKDSTTDAHCREQEWKDHPILCRLLQLAESDPDHFATAAFRWAEQNHQIVSLHASSSWSSSDSSITSVQRLRTLQLRRGATRMSNNHSSSLLPVVFAHGMGDSCFNAGMQHIVQKVAEMLNVYSVCIPTGDTHTEDTKNGYFLNMDASVDVFARKVLQDDQLSHGFHAIGFSQGNNVIRGYIAKYNAPAVHTFLSVNGVNAGIGAVPYCRPEDTRVLEGDVVTTSMCDLLMEQASRAAYTDFSQEHSFQANYWRDPRPSARPLYQQYSQLAVWNNEAGYVNETLKENWAKTSKFVWILATEDGMVWPKEGEHWGAPDPKDPFGHILARVDTEWYLQDLFGLRTAEEAGKNAYESFEGDHLQFSEEDFDRWINTYLRVV